MWAGVCLQSSKVVPAMPEPPFCVYIITTPCTLTYVPLINKVPDWAKTFGKNVTMISCPSFNVLPSEASNYQECIHLVTYTTQRFSK